MRDLKKIASALFFLFLLQTALSARSSFAFYFNSSRTRIKTVIIYNETGVPLSVDWDGDDVMEDIPAGNLASMDADFEEGDCIMLESESDDVSLTLASDRDSLYVYAMLGLDKGRVVKEN